MRLKHFLSVFLTLLTLSVGQMWGADYTWTVQSGDWGTSNSPATSITKGSPSTTWSAAWSWSEESYFNGLQIGSSNNPCTNLTLSTEGIAGTITNITVNARKGSSGTAQIAMSVGGVSVKSSTNLTTSNANYSTGNISKSGEIQIVISNTAKAFYINSISVTYSGTMYSVGWSVNGEGCKGSPTTSVLSGGKVSTLPTNPTPNDCDGSKKYVGWTATPIATTTNTQPSDLFTTAEGAPTVTEAVVYYAVFANQVSAGGTSGNLFNITSYSSTPANWSNSNVGTGNYFLFDAANDALTSPLLDPRDNVQVTCSIATYGNATGNNNLTVQLLDEDGNVKDSKTTATPTSSSYISSGTLSFGTIQYPFKIKFIRTASTGKGVRLQSMRCTGTTLPTYNGYRTSCCEPLGQINGSFFWTTPF